MSSATGSGSSSEVPPTIHGYGVPALKAPLEPMEWKTPDVGPDDIFVKIKACGICYTDCHVMDGDWGDISKMPLVPGHEIVGLVGAFGANVKGFSVGDRVAIGSLCGACMTCECCTRGEVNMCRDQRYTYNNVKHGGFADGIVMDHHFVFHVPDDLSDTDAAPMLCGGVTVYAPLDHYNVRPHHHVGIIGVGGLGHLAIQFASKFGCRVTAISSSPNKREECEQLGATGFINQTNVDELKAAAFTFDFILATAHADCDWNLFLNMLKPDGKLCLVGIPPSAVSFQAFSLIPFRRSIVSNPAGSVQQTIDMLHFAARHNIRTWTETFPHQEINAAVAKLKRGEIRYRAVVLFNQDE